MKVAPRPVRQGIALTWRSRGLRRRPLAAPRVFISFDLDHNEQYEYLLVGHTKNARTPFSMEDWPSSGLVPQAPWEELLKAKINKCHPMVVLVSSFMGSAAGIAKELHVPFLCVGVDLAKVAVLKDC